MARTFTITYEPVKDKSSPNEKATELWNGVITGIAFDQGTRHLEVSLDSDTEGDSGFHLLYMTGKEALYHFFYLRKGDYIYSLGVKTKSGLKMLIIYTPNLSKPEQLQRAAMADFKFWQVVYDIFPR